MNETELQGQIYGLTILIVSGLAKVASLQPVPTQFLADLEQMLLEGVAALAPQEGNLSNENFYAGAKGVIEQATEVLREILSTEGQLN